MALALIDSPKIKPAGTFRLRVFRAGRLVEDWCEPNLVVGGASAIHALLVGGSFANNNVTQIGFGTGLLAPVAGNTTLTGAYTKALDSVTWPLAGQVQFNFSLGSAEDNGAAIGEIGLFTAGGVLYARKVRSAALNKAADIALSGSWTISF